MKSQKATTFYDLNLNQETMRYLFRLVAMKELMKDPRKFGFYLEAGDGYPELKNFAEVEVNGPIDDLGSFAEKYKISYREIKIFNPWLVSSKLTNSSRKTYLVRIPGRR